MKQRAFTTVDLLGTLSLCAVAGSVLAVATDDADRRTTQLKDATQQRMIHQAMVIYASEQKNELPRPGLINRLADPFTGQHLPGQGPEDTLVNHTAPLYSALIVQRYITTAVLISPAETNPAVTADADYDLNQYDPAKDTYWDAAFAADLSDECNTSFAHLALAGARTAKWRLPGNAQFGATFPHLSNRGPEDSTAEGDAHDHSPTLRFFDPAESWTGNVTFADNHVEFRDTMGVRDGDTLFKAEAAADAWLGISVASTDKTVTMGWDPLVESEVDDE